MAKHYMLDFETFSTGKTPVICQIGACYFDLGTGEIGETFKTNVDAQSSLRAGASMELPSVYWWLAQSEEARRSILAEPLVDVTVAMNQLNDFLADADNIWSHATFDFVLMTETLKLLNIKPKFHYRAARDIRTLVSLAHLTIKSVPREGTHHDALDDCKHQAKYVSMAYNKLKKTGR